MTQDAFRPSVNGLRGVAVLMVILFHWAGLSGGFTGVDVFFVISGFLISGHILRELQEGRFSFSGFYAKRIRRILPCLLVILLFAMIVGELWSFDDQYRLLGKHIEFGALFLSNFQLYRESGYFNHGTALKPLQHLWSLAIEEQFYLIWPVFLWAAWKLLRDVRGAVMTATVLSFGATQYLLRHDIEMDFYLLHSRLWELSFGCLVYFSRDRFQAYYNWRAAQLLGSGLILCGCFAIHGESGFPGFRALMPVIGAGLLLGASERGWINHSILSSRILMFLGTISYPLYLWHWVLFSFMKSLTLSEPIAVLGVLTLALSYVTHRHIEKPLMGLFVTAQNQMKIVALGVASLAVIGAVGTLMSDGTLHGRMLASSLPDPIDARTGLHCSADARYPFSPDALAACETLKHPGAPVVLLVGDSHAGALNDGISEFAAENHLNLVTFVTMHCEPLSLDHFRPACRAFNRYVLDWIARNTPDLVIFDANHLIWANERAASKLADIRKGTGKEVLLVGQNPTWDITLPRVLNIAFRSRGLPVPERTDLGVSKESLRWDDILRNEANRLAVPYFSIRDALCNPEGCLVRVGDHLESDLMDFDYGHLSHQGSLFVVRNGLGKMIRELLRRSQL